MFGAEQLCHRRFLRVADAVLFLFGCVINQESSRFTAHRHIGQHELCVLELTDRLAELHSGLRIVDGFLHCAFRDAQCLRGDADTAAVQRLHRDLKALSFLT